MIIYLILLKVIDRVVSITGQDIHLIEGDIRDRDSLEKLFSTFKFSSVIHFAGVKSVSESVAHPLLYYENNVLGSLTLLKTMAKFQVKSIVFLLLLLFMAIRFHYH